MISSGYIESRISRSSFWSSTPILACGCVSSLFELPRCGAGTSPTRATSRPARTSTFWKFLGGTVHLDSSLDVHLLLPRLGLLAVNTPNGAERKFNTAHIPTIDGRITMAKTKPQDRSRKTKKDTKDGASSGTPKKTKTSPEALLIQAATLLQTSQPDEALVAARRALNLLQPTNEPTVAALPALNLLGEINIELGDPESAKEAFLAAIALDTEGVHDGAEKFLWLAQLNEEGGAESVRWFQKGVEVLKREINELESKLVKKPEIKDALDEKKLKIANALCGVAEVYMTDLSWEEDAESRCEAAVTEALLVAPESPEPLQTLASIRISQTRVDDAKAALARSMSLWTDLEPDDPKIPDYSTRISLSRLLMEAGMEDEAIEVLERLIGENDESVEAWYLGGWCLHLIAEKQKASQDAEQMTPLLRASRDWLENCLKLYAAFEYEDERLKDHADEILKELNDILGPSTGEEEEEEEWEDAGEDDDDAEMDGT